MSLNASARDINYNNMSKSHHRENSNNDFTFYNNNASNKNLTQIKKDRRGSVDNSRSGIDKDNLTNQVWVIIDYLH